jgi:hypothetical protein
VPSNLGLRYFCTLPFVNAPQKAHFRNEKIILRYQQIYKYYSVIVSSHSLHNDPDPVYGGGVVKKRWSRSGL